MVFIYVLKQQTNKYYVGKTDNPKFRLDTHFKTGGCAWTKKYKPTQIIGLFPDCDIFDEDKYTIKYMKKYGIENVRGGSFCQVSLDRETKKCVERMICSANDGCHFCGKKGHFIRDCPKNKGKYQKRNEEFLEASKGYESADEVEFEDSDDEELTIENLEAVFVEADKDNGVYTFDGKKYLWYWYELYEESNNKTPKSLLESFKLNDEFEYEDYNWKSIHTKIKKKSSKCHKCGRSGHYTNKCYASRHVKGYAI